MPTIRHCANVNADPRTVEIEWQHFVHWVLTGSERLACDERLCVQTLASGRVTFEPLADNGTRVAFEATFDEATTDVPIADLDLRVIHDLDLFTTFVAQGGMKARHPTDQERHMIRSEAKAENRAHRDGMLDPGSAAMFWRH